MQSTLLVTHEHQSIVLIQRLNTSDELGFERSWCCEDVDEDSPPQDGTIVGDDYDDDFPLREGSSPDRIAPPEGKSAPTQVLH